LASTVHHQQAALVDLAQLWKTLKESGRGKGAKKWDEREKTRKEVGRRMGRARDGYVEARDGLE
jgi:hypothetical protein